MWRVMTEGRNAAAAEVPTESRRATQAVPEPREIAAGDWDWRAARLGGATTAPDCCAAPPTDESEAEVRGDTPTSAVAAADPATAGRKGVADEAARLVAV